MLTSRRTEPAARRWAAVAAHRPRFEVIPLGEIAAKVGEHLPHDATVTITASPRRGLRPTLELATELALRGVHTVPHLAARQIRDEAELTTILGDLAAAGVSEIFTIGGDADPPVGQFTSALELLTAMSAISGDFTIGIAGYPEPHPKISDDVAIQAMWDKQRYAHYIVSQMCFDARVLTSWVERIRRRGVGLPVRIGLAGPTSTQQLLRISAQVGVGESARVLGKQGRGAWRLARPGSWQPDRLLADLAPALADPAYGLDGLHVYTFNALDSVGQWWQQVADHQPGPVPNGGHH